MSVEPAMDVEQAVRDRYSGGARAVEDALCCAPNYDARYLDVIPREIIEKDYGCGDPTPYCEEGMTVLDLGSGGGKACYILSQRVGPAGNVIGVDMNDDMLALARKHQDEIAGRIGYANVDFRKGRIQDLSLNLELIGDRLAEHPITSAADLAEFETYSSHIAATSPLVEDACIDLIVSNCVLNLVRPEDKPHLFSEMFRVLRHGGRVVISDIVSDEDVPEAMMRNKELWSGCISGAYREDLFLQAFEEAGFHGIEILKLDDAPWRTVEGIEFRSMTLSAYKGKQGPCFEHNQAVLYKGPFSQVRDDDNHRYPRGVRIGVCKKTFDLLKAGPYCDQFIFIEPRNPVASEDASAFDCSRTPIRHPRETKGDDYTETTETTDSCCGSGGCC